MDVLTDVLNALELKGWLSSRLEIAPPWHINFAHSRDCIFHILHFGNGYLQIEGETTPRRVADGDVLVFPYGDAHTLCDNLTSPVTKVSYLDYHARRTYQISSFEGEGTKNILLCGAFHFEHPDEYPLLQCLPKLIHIPGEQGRLAHGFTDIVNLIARESTSRQPGTETMLKRLTELLFIQVLRVWIEQQTQAPAGWLAALRDQSISTALGLIHQFPERGWKVAELADAVALSRSAFSSRFTSLVGEPPMKYLIRWRMHLATRLLKNGVKMGKITEILGYESEVAFRKAFTREVGTPPATYRKRN
ncbi:MAG TPA: AraC family transcriptional regulator [Ktedonobacteraceae bacterium]|jgi:AraC-like DNA-binding protein|nr:AraC family transcriptional regulator [Ktedonobacteraceae bacterium]